MIHAVYYKKYHRVTVKGHAHSAEKGHDLVCAAASMLVSTLAANVAQLHTKGIVQKKTIILDDGCAEVSCTASNKYKYTVEMIYLGICVGFELLSQRYPEYVTYEIRG